MRTPFRAARACVAVSILAGGLATAAPAQAATPFSAPFLFSAGPAPVAETIHDFNGDGLQDVAVADQVCTNTSPYTSGNCIGEPGRVWVRLGGPLGTFSPAVAVAVAANPTALASGDFTGDGHPDIAVLTGSSPTAIQLLPGNGFGGFGPAVTLPAPPNLMTGRLLAGDFDGHPGLATTDTGDNIDIYTHDGHGSLALHTSYPFGQAVSLGAVADFNGDGRPDILAIWSQCTPSGPIGQSCTPRGSILYGDGQGGIASRQDIAQPLNGSAVAIGDANGDGKLDIVDGGGLYNGELTSYLGDGNGGFSAPITTDVPNGSWMSSTTLADFDGDGRLDVVAMDASGTLWEASGDGHGKFSGFGSGRSGGTPVDLAVADFLGDGRPDIAAVNSGFYSYPNGPQTLPGGGLAVIYNLSPPSWWPSSFAWAWPSVLAQWASGAWPSGLRPWDINSWLPVPPISSWQSLLGPLAGIASVHHGPSHRVLGPAALRRAGTRHLPRWLTPRTVSHWAAVARLRSRRAHALARARRAHALARARRAHALARARQASASRG